jgi:hypothetical protein
VALRFDVADLPTALREQLRFRDGDKIVLIEDGEVVGTLAPGTLGDLAAEIRVVIEGRDDRALTSGTRHTWSEPELEA